MASSAVVAVGASEGSEGSALGPTPRVLLACDWFVKYTVGLAGGLADQGCPTTLLTRDHDLEFGGEVGKVQPGVMRRYVAEALDGRVSHVEIPGRVSDVKAVPGLLSVVGHVRRRRADVVHVQDSVTQDPRLMLVAGLRPRTYAVTVHDPTPYHGERVAPRVEHAARRALLRYASLIFVHSQELRAELEDLYHPSAPIEVVPHGTDSPIVSPLPEEPNLLFFGRLSHYKGIDVLLDAMPKVWRDLPHARLSIAGAGPLPDHRVLADARVDVCQKHLAEEELPALFAQARCVVLPYRQASQSGVGAKAKAHGRPVVATAVGGLPELLADGSGRIVPPEDSGALAAALIDVLSTPGTAEGMADAATAGALEVGWPRVAAATLAAYRLHLSGSGAA